MTQLQALEKAIKLAGSQEKLGELIGYSQSAISQMLRSGRATVGSSPLIEFALQGAVTCQELRPDKFKFRPKKVTQ